MTHFVTWLLFCGRGSGSFSESASSQPNLGVQTLFEVVFDFFKAWLTISVTGLLFCSRGLGSLSKNASSQPTNRGQTPFFEVVFKFFKTWLILSHDCPFAVSLGSFSKNTSSHANTDMFVRQRQAPLPNPPLKQTSSHWIIEYALIINLTLLCS